MDEDSLYDAAQMHCPHRKRSTEIKPLELECVPNDRFPTPAKKSHRANNP